MKTILLILVSCLVLLFLAACGGNTLAETSLVPSEIGVLRPGQNLALEGAPTAPIQTVSPTTGATDRAPSSPEEAISVAYKKTLSVPHRLKSALTLTGLPANKTVTVESLEGEFDGTDAHVLTQSLFTDDGRVIEIITLGDEYYVHGPAPSLGVAQAGWFNLPKPYSDPVGPALGFIDYNLQYLKGAELVDTETLDGVSCEVYSRGRDATLALWIRWFLGGISAEQLELFDEADTRFWVCADSYLHQVTIKVRHHDKDAPEQKLIEALRAHYTDLNSSIVITAPSQANVIVSPADATATAAAAALGTAAPEAKALFEQARQWDVVYSDSFDFDTGQFPIGVDKYRASVDSFGEVNRVLKDGKYHWEAAETPIGDNQLAAMVSSVVASDVYASVDVRRLQGENYSMGVVIRADSRGHYLFTITEDSRYFDLYFHDATAQGPANYVVLSGKTDAIRPDEANRLTVIAKERSLFLFINDRFVGSAEGKWNTEGQVGVEMHPVRDNRVIVEFDNFEVRVP